MIELEFYIPVPPEKVWTILTQDAHIRKWWGPEVRLDGMKRGEFTESWASALGTQRRVRGSVTAFEPPTRLQLDYRQDGWPRGTRLEFLLAPEKPGTRLYLQHSGWDMLPDEKGRVTEVDVFTRDWTELMECFVRYCSET